MSAPWLLAMWWHDICTLHWRVEASSLEALLPAGLTLDRHDGDAWLSIVPFRMSGVHLRFSPVVPGFTSVPEINLRTYVRAGSTRGIYFFSLDAASPLMVRSARLVTGLPYRIARMEMSGASPVHFRSERETRAVVAGKFEGRYEPIDDPRIAEPASLEAFLHERYRFFLRRAGRLWSGEVRHEPWPLQRARVDIRANTLGALANAALSNPPERCYFAKALRVRATSVRPFAPSI